LGMQQGVLLQDIPEFRESQSNSTSSILAKRIDFVIRNRHRFDIIATTTRTFSDYLNVIIKL
jgi:hypothetical protein